MRIHFQEKPYDLLAALILTGAAVGALLVEGPVRIVLGLLLVLLVPGYVTVAALFPSQKDLDWVERIALSVGLSIAVVPLLGLLLNFSPWGIRLAPIVAALALFITGVGLLAYWRRMRLPAQERLALALEVAKPAWAEYAPLDKALTVGLALSLVVAGGMVAYIATVPRPGEKFTEFYILDRNGKAEAYPTNLTAGANGTVIVGVVNREGSSLNYTVVATLEQYAVTTNATGAQVKSLVGSAPVDVYSLVLRDGAKSEAPLPFAVTKPGLFRLELQLLRQGMASPYRELHLWIQVSP